MNSPTLNIGVVYRPPDSETQRLEKCEEYIEDVTNSGHERIIMGTSNINQLKAFNLKRSMEIFR